MSALTEPTRPARPPDEIDHDFPCYGCGYNLRGLDEDATCPECAMRISNSLGHLRRLGREGYDARTFFPARDGPAAILLLTVTAVALLAFFAWLLHIDPRTSSAALVGVGGVGLALCVWFASQRIERLTRQYAADRQRRPNSTDRARAAKTVLRDLVRFATRRLRR